MSYEARSCKEPLEESVTKYLFNDAEQDFVGCV